MLNITLYININVVPLNCQKLTAKLLQKFIANWFISIFLSLQQNCVVFVFTYCRFFINTMGVLSNPRMFTL